MQEQMIVNGYNGNDIAIAIDNAAILPDNVILLNLRFSQWSNEAKADKSKMEVDSNKQLLSLKKHLLESESYEDIDSFVKRVTKQILTRALPASKTLRPGFYRIPLLLLAEIDFFLNQYKSKFDNLVEIFLANYESAKDRASLSADRGGLGALYNDADYPTVAELRQRFSMTWSYLTFSVPQSLPQEVKEREEAKFIAALEAQQEECCQALRLAFAGLIDRAADRLKSTPDGKPQRFTTSLQEQLADFLSTFEARNTITQDATLAALVAKARDIFALAPDLNSLKDNAGLRKVVQSRFEQLGNDITTANLVPDRVSRAIKL